MKLKIGMKYTESQLESLGMSLSGFDRPAYTYKLGFATYRFVEVGDELRLESVANPASTPIFKSFKI